MVQEVWRIYNMTWKVQNAVLHKKQHHLRRDAMNGPQILCTTSKIRQWYQSRLLLQVARWPACWNSPHHQILALLHWNNKQAASCNTINHGTPTNRGIREYAGDTGNGIKTDSKWGDTSNKTSNFLGVDLSSYFWLIVEREDKENSSFPRLYHLLPSIAQSTNPSDGMTHSVGAWLSPGGMPGAHGSHTNSTNMKFLVNIWWYFSFYLPYRVLVVSAS